MTCRSLLLRARSATRRATTACRCGERSCARAEPSQRRTPPPRSRSSAFASPVDFALRRLAATLTPVRAFAALLRSRLDPAREHRLERLDTVRAIFDRGRVHAGVHANRIARARLDTQAAHDAAQLVDLEHRRLLLDALVVGLGRNDRDAV